MVDLWKHWQLPEYEITLTTSLKKGRKPVVLKLLAPQGRRMTRGLSVDWIKPHTPRSDPTLPLASPMHQDQALGPSAVCAC